MTVTIDASVVVSAFTPGEPEHLASQTFMAGVRDHSTQVLVPTIIVPEISAAISRGQGNPRLGLVFAQELGKLPFLIFVDVDETLALIAAEVAARYRLRASDAVYAAVSMRFGTELVTLDREQLERLPQALAVRKP